MAEDEAQQQDSPNEPPPPQERGLHTRIGPLDIDWPRTVGYYGGLALATGFELIAPPLAIFIATIPFIKMLDRPLAPQPARFAAHLLQGAAQPVSGSGEGTITLKSPGMPLQKSSSQQKQARKLADDPSVSSEGTSAPSGRRPRRSRSAAQTTT